MALTIETVKVTDPDGATGDSFGHSVAVDGDRIIVSAGGDDTPAGGVDAGSVVVLEPDGSGGWSTTKLTAADGAADDEFGTVVADGGRIVVSSVFDDTAEGGENAGSVVVFEPDGLGGWSATKLTEPDGAAFNLFGSGLAIDGDRIVVGAPGDATTAGEDAGSVTIFEPDGMGGWNATELIDPAGAAGDAFGNEVAIDGDRIAVAAIADGTAADGSLGSVNVFEPDGLGGWTATKLIDPDGDGETELGWSLALDGDRIVSGAPHKGGAPFQFPGSVSVFERNGPSGWTHTKLTDPEGVGGDGFGWDVAVAGDRLVATSIFDGTTAGEGAGSIIVYEPDGFGGWEGTKLTDPDGAAGDFFGRAVVIDGDRLVVGAVNDDSPAAEETGSVVLLDLATLDSDDDSLPDQQDPDTVGEEIEELDDDSFKGVGHEHAFLAQLEQAEQLILAGDIDAAIDKLEKLRSRTDGCDGGLLQSPDNNDWIVDCEAQHVIRQLIDDLIEALGG